MRQVIKAKVHSALCNEEAFQAHDKAMYVGKREMFDKETEEFYEVYDTKFAKRTPHPDIQPSSVRIRNYKAKSFGKKYEQARDAVKANDHALAIMKKKNKAHGLMTAQLGSAYDVPLT